MEGPVEELVRVRIKDLWEKTDFSATLFESLVGYAVIAADFDGNVLAFNEGARQIYGYDPQEVVGRQNIEVFFPHTFLEAGYLQQIVDVLLATGRFFYEGEKVRKGGEHFPAQVLFTLTKDRAGKVVGLVEIVQDLTERKRAEEELRNHRDHLGVLVAERSADLARANEGLQAEVVERKRVEAELRQRAQELAEADRRKDAFLSMLAHELRNPLAPLRNGLHLLHLAGPDRQALERARAIMERQVAHLVRLVDDLLDVSRITQGKIQVRRELLDLAGLVRTTAEDRRPTLEQAGLRLTLDLPADPVWVTGDATRLAQVLSNLLDNAAKFNDHGDRVEVRLGVDVGRGQAVLTVRDHGIGIEAEMLPHLFDVFAQADRTLDRARGGLGLGLAVVRGLVELHGGEVRAASAGPGQGAEFTVRLPVKEERPALSRLPQAGPPTPRGPLRILVVEDNRDAADSLCLLLGYHGHEVAVAYTGPEGVQKARAWRPDVVLCDIGLPGLDGYGVAAELRRDPSTAKAHLIAITGYGQEEDRRRTRQAGFDHHLTKPVDPADLQGLLKAT